LEADGVYITTVGDILTLKCLSDNFEKALFYLNHILTSPSFDEKSIEKIRNQIINELTEIWDTPLEFVEQLAKEHIYQKHPYSKNSLGNMQSIQNIATTDLKKCYSKLISPINANFVIVGDLSNIELEKSLNKYFKKWSGPTVPDLIFPSLMPPKPENIHIPLQRDQLVMTFVAPSISRTDKNFNHMAIIDLILAGGPAFSSNSRLFGLREKFGLFYAIGGSLLYNAKDQPGMMIIKTLVSSDKVELTKKLVLECINNLGQKGITAEEFESAKSMILSGNIEHFESNFKMASAFLFFKKFKLNTNLFDKMGDIFSIIKIEDVNKVAKTYCQSRRFSIITVGRAKTKGW
jgi:zinc protease